MPGTIIAPAMPSRPMVGGGRACGGAGFARADGDARAVRADDLDDRADVADLAVVAEAFFECLHLLGHDAAHLRLIEGHRDVLLPLGLSERSMMALSIAASFRPSPRPAAAA